MKSQVKKELHTKSVSELIAQLKEERNAMRLLKLDKETGKLKNTSSLTQKRVEIAVISTIINEKSVKGDTRVAKADKAADSKKIKPAAKADKPFGKAQGKEGGKSE